jgi:hypothetical protein
MLMKRYETRTTASRFGVGTGCAHLLGRVYGGLRNRKPGQRLSCQYAVMVVPEAFAYYSVDTPGIGPGRIASLA